MSCWHPKIHSTLAVERLRPSSFLWRLSGGELWKHFKSISLSVCQQWEDCIECCVTFLIEKWIFSFWNCWSTLKAGVWRYMAHIKVLFFTVNFVFLRMVCADCQGMNTSFPQNVSSCWEIVTVEQRLQCRVVVLYFLRFSFSSWKYVYSVMSRS